MGMDVFAPVADTHIPSKSTFMALGFEIIDCVHWIKTLPKNSFKWRD